MPRKRQSKAATERGEAQMTADQGEEHQHRPLESIDPRFASTFFVVEANSFETLCLWRDNEEDLNSKKPWYAVKWVQESKGACINVGFIGSKPVGIVVFWNILDGYRVAFWEPTTSTVDYEMIDKWFKKNCNPKYDNGTRRAWTDAMNFHHVLHAIADAKLSSKG